MFNNFPGKRCYTLMIKAMGLAQNCHTYLLPSSKGSCTSTTDTNFSSIGPSSANPGASSASGVLVSTVVLTKAIHLLLAATLWAYEQQNTYMSARYQKKQPACMHHLSVTTRPAPQHANLPGHIQQQIRLVLKCSSLMHRSYNCMCMQNLLRSALNKYSTKAYHASMLSKAVLHPHLNACRSASAAR